MERAGWPATRFRSHKPEFTHQLIRMHESLRSLYFTLGHLQKLSNPAFTETCRLCLQDHLTDLLDRYMDLNYLMSRPSSQWGHQVPRHSKPLTSTTLHADYGGREAFHSLSSNLQDMYRNALEWYIDPSQEVDDFKVNRASTEGKRQEMLDTFKTAVGSSAGQERYSLWCLAKDIANSTQRAGPKSSEAASGDETVLGLPLPDVMETLLKLIPEIEGGALAYLEEQERLYSVKGDNDELTPSE